MCSSHSPPTRANSSHSLVHPAMTTYDWILAPHSRTIQRITHSLNWTAPSSALLQAAGTPSINPVNPRQPLISKSLLAAGNFRNAEAPCSIKCNNIKVEHWQRVQMRALQESRRICNWQKVSSSNTAPRETGFHAAAAGWRLDVQWIAASIPPVLANIHQATALLNGSSGSLA